MSIEAALHRLDQAEARILAKYPKATRDPELTSLLSSLRDELLTLQYELANS